MQMRSVPDELLSLRSQIDKLDEELLKLLASRFQVTAQVGRLKGSKGLNSLDEAREKQKLIELQRLASEMNLNPDFVLNLFQLIFAEVVENHRTYLK